jgi:hypothetical protein
LLLLTNIFRVLPGPTTPSQVIVMNIALATTLTNGGTAQNANGFKQVPHSLLVLHYGPTTT